MARTLARMNRMARKCDSHGSHTSSRDSHGSHCDSHGSHCDSHGSLARTLVRLPNSEKRTKFKKTADTLMTFARDFFLPKKETDRVVIMLFKVMSVFFIHGTRKSCHAITAQL